MPIELRPAAPPRAEMRARDGRQLTGAHVLVGLLAFFGVIFAVNMTLMVMAIRTMPGTVVTSAYEASQHFNHELGAIAAQDRRGWQVDIATTGLGSGAPLNVHVRTREGEAIAGLDIRVRLERPTDARLDQNLALADLGGGRYAAALPTLAAGQWMLNVEILRGAERRFVSERRIILKD